ncbi:fatty acid desaturase [Oryzifoliimicrobium ureilyticus]|uniref:fatty acid desaturase n=1 Tax=Oryzifoliimicrobium ureilyticus TaxID=3113724 RepID=UPI0030764A7C
MRSKHDPSPKTNPIGKVEWQTVLLALVIYASFLAVTWFWRSLPLPILVLFGGWLIAWHGSLQHEAIHGHPTRKQAVNDAIAWPPLSLWLPYAIYRQSHLVHHRDEHLTDPIEDPESSYLTQTAWERLGRTGRIVAELNMTLLGRLTIGPFVMIASFLAGEAIHLASGDKERRLVWFRHLLGVTVILWWTIFICKMPIWLYFLGFVYVGAALTRLRSYAEHRYADEQDERTAIVENSPVFGLLFLYNNLHVVHHQRPAIPWYRIRSYYAANRANLLKLNGGLVYDGYLEIARKFLLKPHDDPRHPAHAPIAQAATSKQSIHDVDANSFAFETLKQEKFVEV